MIKMLSIKQVTWCVTASLLCATATLFSMELPSRNLSQTLITVTLTDGEERITKEQSDLLLKHSSVIKRLVANNNNPNSINLSNYFITKKSFDFIISALSSNYKNIDTKDEAIYKALDALKISPILYKAPEMGPTKSLKRKSPEEETKEDISIIIPAENSNEFKLFKKIYTASQTFRDIFKHQLESPFTAGATVSLPANLTLPLNTLLLLASQVDNLSDDAALPILQILQKFSFEQLVHIILAADFFILNRIRSLAIDTIARHLVDRTASNEIELLNGFVALIENILPKHIQDHLIKKIHHALTLIDPKNFDVELLKISIASLNEEAITAIAINSKSSLSAFGFNNGTIELWDIAKTEHLSTIITPNGIVSTLDFGKNDELLAVGKGDGATHIINLENNQLMRTYDNINDAVSTVKFIPGTNNLLIAYLSGEIDLRDIQTGNSLWTIDETRAVESVVILSKQNKFASATYKKKAPIIIREINNINANPYQLRPSDVTASSVNSMTTTADEKLLVSGSEGGLITVWNLDIPHQQSFGIDDLASISSVALSPHNNDLLAVRTTQAFDDSSDSEDSNESDVIEFVEFWDINAHQKLQEFQIAQNDVSLPPILFAPDGKTVICADKDALLFFTSTAKYLLKKSFNEIITVLIAGKIGVENLNQENRKIFEALPKWAKRLTEKQYP